MSLNKYINERDVCRIKWHEVRSLRLELKNSLMLKKYSIIEIRHNTEYRKLKKEQKYISKMIKHIEYKISREIKNET